MPTIEFSLEDFYRLFGREVSEEELEELLPFAKGELEGIEGEKVKVEIKDTNRPDLWSVEGIARELRARVGMEKGIPRYQVSDAGVRVEVDEKVMSIRPAIACAIVKGIDVDDDVLSQLIQLQEKIAITLGRRRREVAIGVYDFDRISPPIKYTTVAPDGIKFVPLDFEEEMTPREILEKHPKGIEYGHIIKHESEYPLLVDSKGNVLSLPPIINSAYVGKVDYTTRNVFVEATGFREALLSLAVNVMATALAERGGRIESVTVVYPEGRRVVTPCLEPQETSVELDYVRKVSGIDFSTEEILENLEKARYEIVEVVGNKVRLRYPAYRRDILHPRDVVEDVIISFGYHNIEPALPMFFTRGKASRKSAIVEKVEEIMLGLGFQQILSYNLTSKENLFDKMCLEQTQVVELENPVSLRWCVFRNSLLPCLLEFLASNKHVEYPQRIFEVGDVFEVDESLETRVRDRLSLACCISDSKVGYEEIASVLHSFFGELGKDYQLKTTSHKSFIDGRVAKVLVNGKEVGVVGEISPHVLEKWKLEKPVAAFELDLAGIIEV